MRNQFLTSVAIAALSLSIAGAMAQERAQERNPAGASPGAASPSSERGSAASTSKSENRSAQGASSSEGAGREGATRNASERGQERSAAGRDNNENKGASSAASSRDDKDQKTNPASAQSNERDGKGAASSAASSRDDKEQKSNPASAQSNERDNKGAASGSSSSAQRSGSDQKSGEGARSSTSATDSKSGSDRTQSQSTSTQNAPSQANPREGAVQNNNQNPSAASTTTSSSTSRTGTASSGGGNVQVRGELDVDQQSATRVHDRLIRESGARETNVNINIDIGGRIPDQVRLRPVPADIVQISPRYRNYEYTIVRDEIIIVEPKTKKIVQVISGGNGGHKSTHVLRLDTKQRDLVKRDVLKTRTGSVNRGDLNIELRQGMEVPDRIMLQTFPEEVWRDAPELREVRYFIVQDEVVLVDPDTREVIEIIR